MPDAPTSALTPYARRVLERARRFALAIHADEVGPEHLLCALMEDEDCAAHRAVLHAFADPETIREEALAMAAGILVSGSAASLPFSPGGVRALRAARARAAERGGREVLLAHLLSAAAGELPDEVRADLEDAGWSEAGLTEQLPAPAGPGSGVRAEGALFRHFSEDAKRALSAAARTARRERAEAIGPAHLLLALLGADRALEDACGVSAAHARVLLKGRSEDPSPPEERPIEADEALERFLADLPAGATTLALLARFHGGGTAELAQLLRRHRVTTDLLERAAPAFEDPAAP